MHALVSLLEFLVRQVVRVSRGSPSSQTRLFVWAVDSVAFDLYAFSANSHFLFNLSMIALLFSLTVNTDYIFIFLISIIFIKRLL